MQKNKPRFWRHSILLALPSAALVAFAIGCLAFAIPRIFEEKRAMSAMKAHETANELKSSPESCDFIWEYGVGVTRGDDAFARRFPSTMTWSDWTKTKDGSGERTWGWKDGHGVQTVVWIRQGKTILGKTADLALPDFGLALLISATLLIISLVALAVISIYYLISYAKSRDDFVSATIHDFAAPLAALKMSIGRNDKMAMNLATRLTCLVENMRDYRRGDNNWSLSCEKFNLHEAFERAYSIYAADYANLRGKELEVAGDRGISAFADPIACERIIWNLIGNEIKYAAPFTDVQARLFCEGDYAFIEISDEGPGMSRKEMRSAFKRYWRARNTRNSGVGGSGIGLAVSRDAARKMGGDLTLRPNSPTGCVFTLSLPTKPRVG